MRMETSPERVKRGSNIIGRCFTAGSIVTTAALIIIVCAPGFQVAGAEYPEGYSPQEISALKSIVQIRGAQTDHHANSKAHTFAGSLKELYSGEKAHGISFIDKELSTGGKDGYLFRIRVKDESEYQGLQRWRWWSVEAKPAKYGEKGDRKSFYCDLSGRIRAEDIGGGWGTPEMKVVPEGEIAKLTGTAPNRSSLKSFLKSFLKPERRINEPKHIGIIDSSDLVKKKSKSGRHPWEAEGKDEYDFFIGYGNYFDGMREYFDENGKRVWDNIDESDGKATYFKDKTMAQWEMGRGSPSVRAKNATQSRRRKDRVD